MPKQNSEAKTYVGKSVVVEATPMTRLEYNLYRDWVVPANENPNDHGFLIEVPGSKSNDDRHSGYISWLPKDRFDSRYSLCANTNLTFGDALERAKQGHQISRTGWNGKDLSVLAVKESRALNGDIVAPHFLLRQGSQLSSWVPSSTDCFATDWQVTEI